MNVQALTSRWQQLKFGSCKADYSLGKSSGVTVNYESSIGRPREEISLAERLKGQDRCSLASEQAVNVNVPAT